MLHMYITYIVRSSLGTAWTVVHATPREHCQVDEVLLVFPIDDCWRHDRQLYQDGSDHDWNNTHHLFPQKKLIDQHIITKSNYYTLLSVKSTQKISYLGSIDSFAALSLPFIVLIIILSGTNLTWLFETLRKGVIVGVVDPFLPIESENNGWA